MPLPNIAETSFKDCECVDDMCACLDLGSVLDKDDSYGAPRLSGPDGGEVCVLEDAVSVENTIVKMAKPVLATSPFSDTEILNAFECLAQLDVSDVPEPIEEEDPAVPKSKPRERPKIKSRRRRRRDASSCQEWAGKRM